MRPRAVGARMRGSAAQRSWLRLDAPQALLRSARCPELRPHRLQTRWKASSVSALGPVHRLALPPAALRLPRVFCADPTVTSCPPEHGVPRNL